MLLAGAREQKALDARGASALHHGVQVGGELRVRKVQANVDHVKSKK